MLILGSGMGSTMQILAERGYTPRYTLVEADKTILQWALEFAPAGLAAHIEPVCADAEQHMAQNSATYHLIFIDIFIGRRVPSFVISLAFLRQCRAAMAPGGHLAFNYIINDEQEWQQACDAFSIVFPRHTIIDKGENRIFVTSL
ncbi:hypothetical protein [Nemorincola caseinilytica]